MGHSGFSLIELLATVAIILILVTLYWGPNSTSRQRALQTSCRKNLEKLYLAVDLYASDHRRQFPVVSGAATSAQALDPLVPRYTSDTALFICPASKDPSPPSGEPIRARRISYAYYMGRTPTNRQALITDRQVDSQAKEAGQLIFSNDGKPPGDNHRQLGGNLLFCDGHVEPSPARTAVPLPLGPGEALLNPAQ